MIEEGIPESIIELPCPDDELRVTMLQEFLIIDHKYRENLVDLDANYLNIVRYKTSNFIYIFLFHRFSIENGGWDINEHEILVRLYEIYPVDLKKRRTCIYDHFHRYYPNRSRQEMVIFLFMNSSFSYFLDTQLKHEEWCNARTYYLKHKRLILFEWYFDISLFLHDEFIL
jgi:hypothetical protein